jgi:hypothetical protein
VGTNLQDNTEMGVSAEASQDFTSIGPVCTYGAPGDPCLPLVSSHMLFTHFQYPKTSSLTRLSSSGKPV